MRDGILAGWCWRGWIWIAGLALGFAVPTPAEQYQNNEQLARELRLLSEAHPKMLRLHVLARTGTGQEVWMLEMGYNPGRTTPAMLAVAGLEDDLLGTASLLAWAKQLSSEVATAAPGQARLESTTLYLVPRLNPEAASGYFSKPRQEKRVSAAPVDEDHDGFVDEDGPDDLDGDQRITMMRVKDAEGEYRQDTKDPRLLVKADRAKGEVGLWRLMPEGLDQDKDELWNEDGGGGVNFNRNFSYNFKFFIPTHGVHPLSEDVPRALADWVIAHPEIGMVVTFGRVDNLLQTPKGEAPKRPPAGIHEADAPYFREFGKTWREALGLKKELASQTEPGSFADWVYYHRGRMSLAAQPWSPGIQLALPATKAAADPAAEGASKEERNTAEREKQSNDKEKKPPEPEKKSGDGDDKEVQEERSFLNWLDENSPESLVPWRMIEHPDFPGQVVEVGGLAPYARSNPPEDQAGPWIQKHVTWLMTLPEKLPRVHLRKVEAKSLGNSVYDITVVVENTGYLPSALAQGGLTREVYPTHVEFDVPAERVLAGQRRTNLDAIPGSGGRREARCVINSQGLKSVKISVVSMLGGAASTEIRLEEE